MKQFFNKPTLLKWVVYVLLIGQLSSNTLSHYYWVIDSESELIELSNVEDNESEEEDKKDEKKDEIRFNFYHTAYDVLIAMSITLPAKDFLSLYHPDVNTPPPKSILRVCLKF